MDMCDSCECCVFCKVEVSVSGWSLIQRSPTKSGVSVNDREASVMGRRWPTSSCAMENSKVVFSRRLPSNVVCQKQTFRMYLLPSYSGRKKLFFYMKIVERNKTGTVRIARNWGAFLQPMLQWKSNYTTWVCVFADLGTQNAMRMRHIVICGLSGSTKFFHIIS